MATFLDFLEKRRDELNSPKRVYSRNDALEVTMCNLIVQEYNEIIREYKKQNTAEEKLDISKCLDCKHYADVNGVRFCKKVKGKSIINPEQVPRWCPFWQG